MITARGVLVSSSPFRLSPLPPPPKRTKECTTSNRIEAQPFVPSSRLSCKCSGTPRWCTRRLVSRRSSNVGQFYREGVWERDPFHFTRRGRGVYTPFLLIFSRSNSNKWNYGWRRNFQRLSRIRKFPGIMLGIVRGDKAFADIFTGPDSNKMASREFSPPSMILEMLSPLPPLSVSYLLELGRFFFSFFLEPELFAANF